MRRAILTGFLTCGAISERKNVPSVNNNHRRPAPLLGALADIITTDVIGGVARRDNGLASRRRTNATVKIEMFAWRGRASDRRHFRKWTFNAFGGG